MKRSLRFLVIGALVALAGTSNAQVRYLDEVFTDVQVDTSIVYAQNYEFFTGFSSLQPLKMDVYRPVGDTATNRPVILLSHNGSFLPENLTTALLGLCFKGRSDSSMVELCKRFARRGYVAVSFDYRLGWSATSSSQEVRTSTIIRAVYRAMQDAKSLVRYFKNDFASNSNSYGIDTGKFVIGGSNSGAYVALAAGALNDTAELSAPKFVGSGGPFISQDTLGDFDGFGGVQNHDNYPGISSKFSCVLSLGGCIGDTSWVQPGEVPVLAFHGVNETGSPYNTGIVTTTTGQPVIEVSGPGDYMPYVDKYGNNDVFKPNNFPQGPANIDGQGATTVSIEGLYPFYGTGFEPYNWYDPTCYNGSTNMQALNPGATPTRANLYIDTIMGYASPRLYKLLIDPSYTGPTGIREVSGNIEMQVFPNPASAQLNVHVSSLERPIQTIRLYNIIGEMVKDDNSIASYNHSLNVSNLTNGIYLIYVKLADGTYTTRKVTIER